MAAGSTARTEWMAAPIRACGPACICDARVAQASASPSENRRCVSSSSTPIPPREVARVEQRDAQPGLHGRGDHGLAHRVGVGVRDAARGVVQVVELADGADPGQHHLGERGAGQRQVRVGVEAGGDRVHLLAPRPERSRAGLRAPPQGSMEGVAVGVGEAGQRETGQSHGVARRRLDVGVDGRDALAVHRDEHVPGGGVTAEPGQLAEVRRHGRLTTTAGRIGRSPSTGRPDVRSLARTV